MEILCKQCGTSYLFDEARATGKRMRFKCSKCGNIFECRTTAPEFEKERSPPPEETVRIDMHRRLEEIEADQKRKEDDMAGPEQRPIVVEGIIGASEAGLDESDVPDIEIGEPPALASQNIRFSRHGQGTAWRLAPVLLVTALLVIAISLGLYLMGSTVAPGLMKFLPHRVQRYLTRTQESSVKKLVLRDVEGFFSRNNVVGHIYVIKGKVENRGVKSYRNIRVKGVLYNNKGYPLMERAVSCGVDISDRDLATLSGSEIDARMTALPPERTGMLQPSGTIPFTVVFIDLPKDIYEYSISIIEAV